MRRLTCYILFPCGICAKNFVLLEMKQFLISSSTKSPIIYAIKAEKETAVLPISIFRKFPAQTP